MKSKEHRTYRDRMPISFDLEALRKTHNCVHYFETGLWDPRDFP